MNASKEEIQMIYSVLIDSSVFASLKAEARRHTAHRRVSSDELNAFYIGYRQLTTVEMNRYDEETPPPVPYPFTDQINVTAYATAFLPTCQHFTVGDDRWRIGGCKVSYDVFIPTSTSSSPVIFINIFIVVTDFSCFNTGRVSVRMSTIAFTLNVPYFGKGGEYHMTLLLIIITWIFISNHLILLPINNTYYFHNRIIHLMVLCIWLEGDKQTISNFTNAHSCGCGRNTEIQQCF